MADMTHTNKLWESGEGSWGFPSQRQSTRNKQTEALSDDKSMEKSNA